MEQATLTAAQSFELERAIIQLPFKGGLESVILPDGSIKYTDCKSFEAYKEAKGERAQNFHPVTWSLFQQLFDAYWDAEWSEITQAQYTRACEELPPLMPRWLTNDLHHFFCMEPTSGQFHSCYMWDHENEKYYSARKSRYATSAELLEGFCKFRKSLPVASQA
jgi:hypothetical protein